MAREERTGSQLRLLRPVDPRRDHIRGLASPRTVVVVGYQDFLCPYCRRLRAVYRRLGDALGDRLVYAFRHFPNERAHPGAELASRAAEAAAKQGRFFEMHDALFDREPPIGRAELVELARKVELDLDRFEKDLDDDQVKARVEQDLADGRKNGVTATPTLFVDGIRYDGAWDFDSMLESLDRPLAARLRRSARVFASLPTSAGLVLLVTAALALLCANSPLAPAYESLMSTRFGIGPAGALSLTVRDWLSEGLLSVFFLLVGLEIRRELTSGALTNRRAAVLPVVAALGGVVTPALLYLALSSHATASGWSIPTATDVAFALGLLAVLGQRVPTGLRVFVAALAVVDDLLSIATLAIFYPSHLAPAYLVFVAGAVIALALLNRARVYATWPYLTVSVVLWLSLHALGVHSALAGVGLAMCLPTRPAPNATGLLAQAATALAALEHAEQVAEASTNLHDDPVWEWASRNLSAASDRLASPAERIERLVAPWSAYVVLPAFAFSATGVHLTLDLSSDGARRIFAGILVGLIVGKPLGILVASALAIAARVAVAPEGVSRRQFVGAACLCGVGDTMALLIADRALTPGDAAVAKLAVLVASLAAGVLGLIILSLPHRSPTPETLAKPDELRM
jgi:NhaA family Na+:H+ antiporter